MICKECHEKILSAVAFSCDACRKQPLHYSCLKNEHNHSENSIENIRKVTVQGTFKW